MKKLLTLLLAAGMVVSAANGASAVEMKVSGSWLTSFSFTNNLYGKNALWEKNYTGGLDQHGNLKDQESGHFNAAQRIRINFDMVASESLSGRVQLQVGQGQKFGSGKNAPGYYSWGSNGVAGPGEEVTARLAYLDWIIPSTDVLVRMGRQEVAMPSYTFNSPVLDDVIDGVMVSAPINDMVAVNLGWMRADAGLSKWGEPYEAHNTQDLAYLGVDVTADGFKVSPWGMVGFVGSNSVGNPVIDVNEQGEMKYLDATTHYYWAGIGGELTLFDPFKFTADFMYSGNDADKGLKRSGWYAALGAEMKTAYATPFLRGWYASGDDDDADGEGGRFLSVDGAAAFDASSIYYDAYGLLAATPDVCSAAGTWGVQLGVKEVSFIEDLSHQLSVTYFQGTNNTQRVHDNYSAAANGPIGYMTTADSAWSIDFMNSYKLYQNLTANLLLSYLVTDFDKDVWGQDYDNIFRGTLNFTYAF